MINVVKMILLISISVLSSINLVGQLSQERIKDIAEIKVNKFQNILNLTPAQSAQLRKETINMLVAHGSVVSKKDIIAQIDDNFSKYYASLTSLKPQQIKTLKLMDELERENRRESYKEAMAVYGQTSEFAVTVAAYNWNIALPILVSYRKDLDRYMTSADKELVEELRSKMIEKYNLIDDIRDEQPSKENEAIISAIQFEIIKDIKSSVLPKLLQKYDEEIVQIRLDLKKYENKIKKDMEEIYNLFMVENIKDQINSEKEFLTTFGITNLLRDAFFLLLDGDSTTNSFKINTLYLIGNLQISDQF